MIVDVFAPEIFDIISNNSRLKNILDQGACLYLVGGAVRDLLMQKEPDDYDFCVGGLDQESFKNLFPEMVKVGKNYPIFKVNNYDFDLQKSLDDLKMEDELKRRDFTINAIAVNIKDGKMIDPFNGIKDLEKGVISVLPDAIKKDPLRAYRAARLVSEMEESSDRVFSINKETEIQIKANKKRLESLAEERVFGEFRKALLSNMPARFFKVLKELDILDVHFPEIDALIGVKQPEKYHPEGDVFNHTMLSLEAAVKRTNNPLIRFSVLVHDLGKALTPEEEWPHHYRHDRDGLKPLRKLCNRIKIPVKWRKAGELAINEHMRAFRWKKMRPGKIVHLLEKAQRSNLGIEGLANIIEADRRGRGQPDLEVSEASDLVVLGKEMFAQIGGSSIRGVKEGPEFGKKLFHARCQWLKNKLRP